MRRELAAQLDASAAACSRAESTETVTQLLGELPRPEPTSEAPQLSVLCRTEEQLEAALACGVRTLYLDFEDVRRYKDAVARPAFTARPLTLKLNV